MASRRAAAIRQRQNDASRMVNMSGPVFRKANVVFLPMILVTFLAVSAHGEGLPASRPANPLNFTYDQGQTAVRREVRDPCIFRDGDAYYLVFTMWPFRNREEKHLADPNQGGSPGMAIYSSRDLKSWAFDRWLIKSSDLPENCPYKNRFWAAGTAQV